ncbi:TetR/AcrR family transcriptional regulator [Corynebacterium ulcerans]|uniref:TetR/AcrR family transcriptional regulator n=1 Tax=Corynebacterium ulcerans TaxID=65058 RepID=UPI001E3AC43C|nr:TetR/AcrR family transcriptional regulator [Corynebacterium ulcerans]
MGSREENREKTQAAILDAAEALLREGGVEALTAGAVAQQVGLARNSLYRYVGSMDELRGRVILRHFPDYVDAINQAIHEATTPHGSPVRLYHNKRADRGGGKSQLAHGIGTRCRRGGSSKHRPHSPPAHRIPRQPTCAV